VNFNESDDKHGLGTDAAMSPVGSGN